MNLKESIRRILREESNLSLRRRVKFGEIDKSVKRKMVSSFKKDEKIEKSIDSTVAEVVSDIMPVSFDIDVNGKEYHKIWHELTSFIRQKYGDDLRQYFEKRQNEVDQENNEMGYKYVFVKHDKPFYEKWSGFAKGFNSFDDMITKYGHWIDVDWDEVKQKLDNIKDFPENIFTGRYNSRPLRISNAGDEGNTWGYNFSVIKSIPEENIQRIKEVMGLNEQLSQNNISEEKLETPLGTYKPSDFLYLKNLAEPFRYKSQFMKKYPIEYYLAAKAGIVDDLKDWDTKNNIKNLRSKKEQNEGEITERCWKGYTQKGMKTMFGKRYPNCVKKTNR